MTTEELKTALEELYQKYPRKLGKTPGMKKALREIKTQGQLYHLNAAIEAYKSHCLLYRLEAKYIMHFSTFMGQWEDWLDPEHGSTSLKSANKWDRII